MYDELELHLKNGTTICSWSSDFQAGDYVRVIDRDGNEVGYWNSTEWKEDPEHVMGAILRCASIADGQIDGVSPTYE